MGVVEWNWSAGVTSRPAGIPIPSGACLWHGVGRRAAVAGLALVLGAGVRAAPAQEIQFRARADRPDEVHLERLLQGGTYTLWTRDTILARGSRVDGDVLVLEAAVRVGGEITGSITVVDGDLFLRPGSRVRGDVVVLGGGYYGSSLAVVDGELRYHPSERYRVVPRRKRLYIHAVERRPEALTLHGLSGIKLPTYDRVNEWSFGLGATARAVSWPWRPSLEVVGRFRTEVGEVDGTVRQLWHPTRGIEFGVEAERNTLSNEGWIRSDFLNTFSFLFIGDDFRNYYEADRVAFLVRRRPPATWTPGLKLEWEEARSLVARPHSVVFGDDPRRANPAIAAGEIWSATASVGLRRETGDTRIAARVLLEGADRDIAGDFSYLLGDARVSVRAPALPGHALELFGIARGDLSGTLPPQRWTAFGGRGTLPTFPVLGLRGERIAFGLVTYLVPVTALDLGPLGTPEAFVREAIGAAWSGGESPVFQHNVMVGLRVALLEVALVLDPRSDDAEVVVSGKLRGDL